jgi:hypothetical protein
MRLASPSRSRDAPVLMENKAAAVLMKLADRESMPFPTTIASR